MKRLLKIGTRDSKLAVWQAKKVQSLLLENQIKSELVFVKSYGDQVQDKALHELGSTGVFTKALDIALHQNDVDIAVHSCKDVPTEMPNGIVLEAYLEREDHRDLLICKEDPEKLFLKAKRNIATGSLRRRAQWLNRFSNDVLHNLRGNVQTRMRKLEENDWDAAIFALAGLKRMDMIRSPYYILDWMLSAPAQGIVAAACREEDTACRSALKQINNQSSELQARAERKFLNLMEGGCTAPIGAYAEIAADEMQLEVMVHSVDGQDAVHLKIKQEGLSPESIAEKAFRAAEKEGAVEIVKSIKLP